MFVHVCLDGYIVTDIIHVHVHIGPNTLDDWMLIIQVVSVVVTAVVICATTVILR